MTSLLWVTLITTTNLLFCDIFIHVNVMTICAFDSYEVKYILIIF
jgi:hypothetical protein